MRGPITLPWDGIRVFKEEGRNSGPIGFSLTRMPDADSVSGITKKVRGELAGRIPSMDWPGGVRVAAAATTVNKPSPVVIARIIVRPPSVS
jgi:hypothetical protein